MLNKIILIIVGTFISFSVLANTINVNTNRKNTLNKIMRGTPINNINDVVNIDGPFYEAIVSVFPDRYSNPNLPSDPVVIDCHGKITKIYPSHTQRCEIMKEGERAIVRIDPNDFKLGADIEVLVIQIP